MREREREVASVCVPMFMQQSGCLHACTSVCVCDNACMSVCKPFQIVPKVCKRPPDNFNYHSTPESEANELNLELLKGTPLVAWFSGTSVFKLGKHDQAL